MDVCRESILKNVSILWGDWVEVLELLKRFEGARSMGANRYQCKCPVHNDDKASLTITDTADKILIHCHAGCSTWDIVQEIGLKMSDLYKGEKPPETWQENFERYKKKQIEEIYQYTDAKGRYLYTKLRMTGKNIVYGRINADKTFFNMGMDGRKKILYNLSATIKAIKDGFPVYFVEGEKDVNTLKEMGYTATTCGGVSDWRKEFASLFTGAKVVILPDNDEPGIKLANEIKRDLRNYAHSIKLVMTSQEEKGDISDYIKKEGHSKEDFNELLQSVPAKLAPWLFIVNEGKKNEAIRINEGLLAQSIEKSLEYILLRKKGIEFDRFYVYENGVYNECKKAEVKSHIKKYLPSHIVKDSVLNNVYGLLLSSNSKVHDFEEVNADERYINLKNGIYDIHSRKLLPHTPELLSTYQLKCSYLEKAPQPQQWLKYINDFCTTEGIVDKQQIAVLQEWMGLILSNVAVYRTKKCLALYSPLGNTGKSIFIRTVVDMLGVDMTINIPIQALSDRFSMADVYGKRLIAIGDQKQADIEDSSVFKQITGGDPLRIEKKGKDSFSYKFSGALIMACNGLPSFTDDKGGHVFERMEVMECKNAIPQEKRDPVLYDKITKEFDGIFMWALEGLQRLMANNYVFTQSNANLITLSEYRSRLDTVFAFLKENCEITGDAKKDRIKKTLFEQDYSNWCYLNELNPLHKKNIAKRMEENGVECSVYCGYCCYKGIRYKWESAYCPPPTQTML